MKKFILSAFIISTMAVSSYAQVKTSGINPPAFFKLMAKPSYRQMMAKINQAEKENTAQNKRAYKRPELIYTQLWDSAGKKWTDTLEKYVIVWDNNHNLQSIAAYSWDTTGGNGITKSIETNFIKKSDLTNIDNNVSLNYFPGVVTNQSLQAGQWVNTDKQLITFDKNNIIASVLTQQWTKNIWADSYKLNFAFDSKGNLTDYLIYSPIGGTWKLAQAIKESFTFNKDGFVTDLVQSISSGSSYIPMAKERFVLDSKGAITNALISIYNNNTSTWTKYDSLADVSWLRFDPVLRFNYQTGGTIGILGVGGDKYKGYTESKYDSTTKSWSLRVKHIYSYNIDSLPANIITQNENNKTWANNTSDSTTYYPGGDVKTFLNRYWSNGWQNTSQGKNNQNTYDTDKDITESIVQNTDAFNGSKYNNYSKTEYKYQDHSGIAQPDPMSAGLKIYPNPVAGHLCVAFNNASTSNCTITISDITGKTLQQQLVEKGNTDAIMDVEGLHSGLYFLSLNSGESVSTYKFIKN
jgi:hypothetical protein